jgi:hypothetical protein
MPAGVALVLVDDGSTTRAPDALEFRPVHLTRVQVLHLRRNLGHQRAIAVGLAHIHQTLAPRYTVVMDGDGEDGPQDAARLLSHCEQEHPDRIVFARRRRRTESLGFRLAYLVYRALHRILTGNGVYVGNFSVIPRELLSRVVGVSELCNHYAAAVFHARIPVATLPIDRCARLRGRSKMNVVSLVTHGMSAISVYGDVVGVRLLAATAMACGVVGAGMIAVIATRLLTELAIPGWASSAFGLLFVALLNLIALSTVFVLFVLQTRDRMAFMPLRDFHHLVAHTRTLHE